MVRTYVNITPDDYEREMENLNEFKRYIKKVLTEYGKLKVKMITHTYRDANFNESSAKYVNGDDNSVKLVTEKRLNDKGKVDLVRLAILSYPTTKSVYNRIVKSLQRGWISQSYRGGRDEYDAFIFSKFGVKRR